MNIHYTLPLNDGPALNKQVEIAWHSGSVMGCHATARGSIPGGNGVFT